MNPNTINLSRINEVSMRLNWYSVIRDEVKPLCTMLPLVAGRGFTGYKNYTIFSTVTLTLFRSLQPYPSLSIMDATSSHGSLLNVSNLGKPTQCFQPLGIIHTRQMRLSQYSRLFFRNVFRRSCYPCRRNLLLESQSIHKRWDQTSHSKTFLPSERSEENYY